MRAYVGLGLLLAITAVALLGGAQTGTKLFSFVNANSATPTPTSETDVACALQKNETPTVAIRLDTSQTVTVSIQNGAGFADVQVELSLVSALACRAEWDPATVPGGGVVGPPIVVGPNQISKAQWQEMGMAPSELRVRNVEYTVNCNAGSYTLEIIENVDPIGATDPNDLNNHCENHPVVTATEVWHEPSGATTWPVDTVRFHFGHEIDTSSFSLEDDIASFTGPAGPLPATGYSWPDSHTLEVTFQAQTAAGTYEMVIGPQILDSSGNPMNLDRDLVRGEVPDDQYKATFSITFEIRAPRIVGQTPSGEIADSVQSMRFDFDLPMDTTSFSPSADIASFTGPEGAVAVTGFSWVADNILEVTFQAQLIGRYEMIIGPGVLDQAGSAMNQDNDLVPGETPDDQYKATFTVIVRRNPHGMFPGEQFSVTRRAHSVALGDLNSDGRLDIAVANSGYDSYVDVLPGNGDGTFAPQTPWWVGLQPYSVALGDLNSDGALDIVAANSQSANVTVLLGNGDGTFPRQGAFAVGTGPMSVALGDLNGDGRPDIATANSSSNNVSVLLGNGDGTFAAEATFAVGSSPMSVALGDLNGDGHPDIAAANSSSNDVSVLLGNGDGTFAAEASIAVGLGPRSVALGDLNGDGRLDIAVANSSSNDVSVLLGNGDGTFAAEATFAVGSSPMSVALGDLNGDGHPDIATANSSSNDVSVLLGIGDGTFDGQTTFADGLGPRSVALGDLNSDGHLDIVVANDSPNGTYGYVTLLVGNGDGTFAAHATFRAGTRPTSLALGDLNGDDALDIVTADSYFNTVSVLRGSGFGTFALPATFAVEANSRAGPYSVALGDVNGDGALDIVTANWRSANVSVLLGNGDGTFAVPATFAVRGGPKSVTLGDLNGDGYLDIVTANDASMDVSVLLGNGDGTFAPHATFGVGDRRPVSVALGDLNGDGTLDIVTANGYDVSVLLGNGDGTFVLLQATITHGQGHRSVALGDLNRDGHLDIVTANSAPYSDNVSVLLGNGDGTFPHSAAEFPVGVDPQSVALGDLNGDGDLDIVAANSSSTNVSVLLGNGDGTFARQSMFSVAWALSVAVGELNGDGALDIATANYNSDNVSVLINQHPIVRHDPAGLGMWPVDALVFHFGPEMDTTSFSREDDVVSFTGPAGPLATTAHSWLDPHTLEVTFEQQTAAGSYQMVIGPRILDLAGNPMNTDCDTVRGEVPDDQYKATFAIKAPRLVGHTPSGFTGPAQSIRFDFDLPMDTMSFSIAEDAVNFTGPAGPIAAVGYSWVDSDTLEVTFERQIAVGAYEMAIGPQILNAVGNAMDQDGDLVAGETTDDQYKATFTIRAPRVVGHTPSGNITDPVQSIRFDFDLPMDTMSFSIAEDAVNFTGPAGPIAAVGYSWVDSDTLEVTFEQQTAAGSYQMVIGPRILDVAGNSIDQDLDGIPGETPDDQYSATFEIKAPRVVGQTPSGLITDSVQSMRFDFDLPMDETSFSVAEDIASFTGPNGPISATGYSWVDSDTLELTFAEQTTLGSYEMVIGPQVLDVAGHSMDQDLDGIPGETPDDQYMAIFELTNVHYWSGPVTQDTTWKRGIVVVSGSVTVAGGVTLTIEAGTIVKFSSNAIIDIQGSLDVAGTLEQPVILTSLRDDSAVGDTNGDGGASRPAAGDWEGLRFWGGEGRASIDGTELRYASFGIYAAYDHSVVELRKSTVVNCRWGLALSVASFAQVLVENVVVGGNWYGSSNHGDSQTTFRNATIVDNWGYGIDLGDSSLTLENTILAFNGTGLIHPMGGEPFLEIRNSDLYNDQNIVWIAGGTEPHPIGHDGNISADPVFVDRGAGNYELGAGSPAADAGRGTSAPGEDILGRPRYDDHGVLNTGTGYPSYVDMGAYERQEDTLAPDLAVTEVSGPTPESVGIGDSFTVEWTIANVGLATPVVSWQDVVYLSNDPYISADDLALGTRAHSGTLAPGAAYTETLTAMAPGTSGPKYVLVRTNADRTVPEGSETNNLGVSSRPLGVNVPVLELGVPTAGTLAPSQWNFYRFDGTSGRSVRFSLDAAAISGATGLYLRYSVPPTASQYDAAGTAHDQTDQEAKLLEPLDGTYYVGIYGQQLPGGPTSYTLLAELTELSIASVSPSLAGNAGQSTIEIVGDNLSPEDEIHVVAPDGVAQLSPLKLHYVDPAHFVGTFDLIGASPGSYDVVVVKTTGETATLADALTIVEGGQSHFEANLSVPSIARPGRVIDVRVDYANTGSIDMPSPLLSLTSAANVEWLLPGPYEWTTGPTVRFMALSSTGPAAVLRPGQHESLVVKVRVPLSGAPLNVELRSLEVGAGAGNQSIDWAAIAASHTGSQIDPAFLDAFWMNFAQVAGETWGELIQRIDSSLSDIEAPAVSFADAYSAVAIGVMYLTASSSSGSLISSAAQSTAAGSPAYGTSKIRYLDANGVPLPQNWKPVEGERTYLVVHGWMSWGGADASTSQAQAILTGRPGANVVIVDWGYYARDLIYWYSKSKIDEVSEEVAKWMIEKGIDSSNTEISCHSLGCHLAAFISNATARLTGKKVDACLAADPAGVSFEEADPKYRLDPTDCAESICIHTTSSLGYQEPLCTADIYVPPCESGSNPVARHERAHELVTESYTNHNMFNTDDTPFGANAVGTGLTGCHCYDPKNCDPEYCRRQCQGENPPKDPTDAPEDIPGDLWWSRWVGILTSWTPEDKFGPAGYDAPDTPVGSEMRHVRAGAPFDYRIEFWNKPEAPVPTQDAVIKDTLDPNVFDLSTFEFTNFGFLKWDVPLSGGQAIDTRVDLRPDMNLAVDVKGTFDPDTGEIGWWFHAVDPMTGEYPEDPMAGFLPPFNPDTGFELGWVEFRVKPKAGLPSGTQIANQAFVEFDFAGDIWDHPAPKEGPWINTIDAVAPSSAVAALPAVMEDTSFPVSWSGSDEEGGSGLADFTIYVSDNGGPFVAWVTNTTLTEATFTGEFGHGYAFYSIARDNAGNREAAPSVPDAQTGFDAEPPTTLISLSPPAADGANDWYVSPVTVTLSAQDNEGGSGVATTEYRLNGGPWQPYPGPSTLSADGTTTVEARSTDNAGNVEAPPISATIRIDTTPPVADFSRSPDPIAETQTVQFTDASSDGVSGIASYHWDFGDGATSDEPNPVHAYADNGVHLVSLTVQDRSGWSTTLSQQLAVLNVAPTPHGGGPYGNYWGVPILFSGSATDPSPVDTAAGFSYHWDFGDGTSSDEPNPSHTYGMPGTYAATLTATDKDGGVGTATTVVTVSQRPSSIANEGPFTGQYSDPVSVTARLRDGLDAAPIVAAAVQLSIGGQAVPTAYTDPAGGAATQVVLDQPAGSVNLSASFAGNALYTGSSDGDPFSVLKESTTLTYTGDQIVPSSASSITLRASVAEQVDGHLGNITRAAVLFEVRKALGDSLVGTYGPAPVTQLSPGIGVATLAVPNLAVNDYYVIVRADPGNGYYTAAPSTLTRLTVYQPTKRSAIGAGWISDGGQIGALGFTVMYNTKATGIVGSSLYAYQDGALIYTVLSNAWTGLAFSGTNKASFQGKARVKTYDSTTHVTRDIGSDFSFVVNVVDNGSKGDTYQIAVYDKNGLLYHQTGPTALSGGNIVVSTR